MGFLFIINENSYLIKIFSHTDKKIWRFRIVRAEKGEHDIIFLPLEKGNLITKKKNCCTYWNMQRQADVQYVYFPDLKLVRVTIFSLQYGHVIYTGTSSNAVSSSEDSAPAVGFADSLLSVFSWDTKCIRSSSAMVDRPEESSVSPVKEVYSILDKTSTPKSMLHMFWIQIVTLNNKMYRRCYRIRYSQGSVGDFIGQDNVRILLSFYYKTNIFFHVIQPIKRNSFLIFKDAVL